jgi:hypothetical protein
MYNYNYNNSNNNKMSCPIRWGWLLKSHYSCLYPWLDDTDPYLYPSLDDTQKFTSLKSHYCGI